ANASGTTTITVRVSDDGGTANGGKDTAEKTFTITVTPVADPVTLTAPASASGLEGSPIPLVIAAALSDLDGSEKLGVVVRGVPAGVAYTHGVNNGDGSWTLTAQDLVGLTFTADDGQYLLSVTAFSKEQANGATFTTPAQTVAVTVGRVDRVAQISGP